MKFKVLFLLLVFHFSCKTNLVQGQSPQTPSAAQQSDVIKSNNFSKKAEEYIENGNYEGALRFLEIAIILKNNQKDSSGVADLFAMKSMVYQKQGNQLKAISSILSAIKIHEALGDLKNTALDYKSLGIIYEQQKSYEKAEESFLKANTIFRDFEDSNAKEHTALLLLNLSEIKLRQSQTETALEYGKESAVIYQMLKNNEGIANANLCIGNAYLQFTEYTLAENHFIKALKVLEGLNFPFLKARIYHQISIVYLNQNKLNAAQDFAEKALAVFVPSESINDLKDIYQTLSLIFESKKQPYKALDYFKQHLKFSETSINEENKRIEQEMLVKYDNEKKEAEIRLLEQEQKTKEVAIKKQRFQIVSFAILGFFLVVLVAGLIYYNRNIKSAKDQIAHEKERSENLLLNILPKNVASELKENGKYQARSFPQASVLFVDIADFTKYAETLSPEELVKDIDTYFSAFDEIVGRFGMEKIKTIGDAYMVAGGLQGDAENAENAAIQMVNMGLVFQEEVSKINSERVKANKEIFEMRIGIHTGPVVAGIVGSRKFAYDIWGDTVNIASRMQSSGQVNKLNISQSIYELVKNQFVCTHRGKIDAKNKGAIEMYFVSARK